MNRWKLNKLNFLSFPFSSNIRKTMKLALMAVATWAVPC